MLSGQLRLHETTYTTYPGQNNGAINALMRRSHWFTVTAQLESTILPLGILNLRTLISFNPALYSKVLERALELAGNLLDIMAVLPRKSPREGQHIPAEVNQFA